MIDRSLKRLTKKSRRGFRGYPTATIAAYGPDDRRASKLVATIVRWDGDEAGEMRKWFSETKDVRSDPAVAAEVLAFIEQHGALSIAAPDRIIGCPHEEGIDYQGDYCPACFYWFGRDRWTGQLVSSASRQLH